MARNSAKRLANSRRKQWQSLLQSNDAISGIGKDESLRIVLDTNVWYSAILYGGKPEEAVKVALNDCRPVTSPFIIDGLKAKLKLDAKAPYKWLNALEKHLNRVCVVIEAETPQSIVRDPNDDPVAATAIQGGCNYIITGDYDLLSLGVIDSVEAITVSKFLELVDR